VDWLVAEKLALAPGLGLLVGFQREWTAPHVAGIRTFALITVFGTVIGLFFNTLGGWIVGAGVFALTAMIVVVNIMRFSGREKQPGLTTQVAALIMYAVGVAIAIDQMVLAVIVGGVVAVLLQWKRPLHGFVERIGEKDARAIFQLVLIGLVVLPVLPDKDYGPYRVINPYEIWLMVVLICGISVGSYLAYKFLGPRAGTVLGGILGGLISSTATTVSYSRRSRKTPDVTVLASLVIMVASTIVFGRVIVEIAIVAPTILPQLAPPLAVMMVLMMLISAAMYMFVRKDEQVAPLDEDPSDLKSALLFGILYAAVLFAVAVAKEHFGDEALYGVAALSGLTDMDAITLSTAQMIKADRLAINTGWRMILVGAMSNLFFKACAVAFLGNRRLLRRVVFVFGLSFVGGVLLLVFWP
jgi:uncharacterized membrane protein (DUF4010 family)